MSLNNVGGFGPLPTEFTTMETNKPSIPQKPSTVDKLIAVAKSPVSGLLIKGAVFLLITLMPKR
jgi:hypothetical protein